MNLLLDLGNSRLKWGLSDSALLPLSARGSATYSDEGLQSLRAAWENVDINRVCYASVVDPARERAVLALLPSTVKPTRLVVSEQFGILQNAYATPETLGLDRWAAAIGAWNKVQGACLVVCAGTATTVDVIDVTETGGLYRGGLILPGIDLMLQSLHQGTARLPEARGFYRAMPDLPDNTEDAIFTGAIESTCGAIMRMGSRLPADAPWLLTGGRARTLQDVLGNRVTLVEDLVLEGLAQV